MDEELASEIEARVARDLKKSAEPTAETMLAGILEAASLAAELAAGTGKTPESVVVTLERNTRTGYVTAIDRTTGIGGDPKRTIRYAVESLYQNLTAKAAGEARKANEMLTRLGVKPPPDGPQG